MPLNADTPSIFGLGTIVVDHQVFLKSLPEADTKGEAEGDRYQVGGPVPTALCLLRRLGLQATFHGRWAEDHFGEIIEADLLASGIDFDPPLKAADARTGFAHVWVEQATGRRSIAAFRGSHLIQPGELDAERIAAHDALHLDGWSGEAAIAAMRVCRESGGRIFMDLGSPKPDLPTLLEHVDALNCPARLIGRLFQTRDLELGARQLMALGPREITITSGEEGAMHVSSHGTIRHPGYAIKPVDTNGAGDVFTGAMIFAALRRATPQEMLDFACAAAALKCTKLGNRDALPTRQAVEDFLAAVP
jgi:sugar/nucleoside kinase (ribokinase family)